jgi:hypothetical protein
MKIFYNKISNYILKIANKISNIFSQIQIFNKKNKRINQKSKFFC